MASSVANDGVTNDMAACFRMSEEMKGIGEDAILHLIMKNKFQRKTLAGNYSTQNMLLADLTAI